MQVNKKAILPVIIGALVLLCAAFFNGFPIVYADTSTYLDSAFQFETPFDRPITYGLFLRFASLNGLSLWFVILTQALILSGLIYLFLKLILDSSINRNRFFIGLMFFLALLTSASWTTSQLISDIFTPIMLLSFVLLAFGKYSKSFQVVLYVIFLVATAMHMSHITFNVVFFISILVLRIWNVFGLKDNVKLRPILICFVLSILSISTMGSALSKSKHVFLMGALVEHGIAKEYLDEHCGDNKYALCAYKDSLPEKATEFIWDASSPLYKLGGFEGTKDEFTEIINGTLTSPKYLGLHVVASVKATADQLLMFNIGDGNSPEIGESPVDKRVGTNFPHEIDSYRNSRQSKDQFGFLSWYNSVLGVVVILSFVLCLFLFYKSEKRMRAILFVVLLSIFFNAWVCGTFANAIDRLGTKVIWLIPLIAFIGVSNYVLKAKRTSKN